MQVLITAGRVLMLEVTYDRSGRQGRFLEESQREEC